MLSCYSWERPRRGRDSKIHLPKRNERIKLCETQGVTQPRGFLPPSTSIVSSHHLGTGTPRNSLLLPPSSAEQGLSRLFQPDTAQEKGDFPPPPGEGMVGKSGITQSPARGWGRALWPEPIRGAAGREGTAPEGWSHPGGVPAWPGNRSGLRQQVRGGRAPAVSVRQSCGPAPEQGRGPAGAPGSRCGAAGGAGPVAGGGSSRVRGAQSVLRWLLLRTGWPLERGPFLATSSSSSELSVSSRSLRSSSTTFPVMNFWAMRMMR